MTLNDHIREMAIDPAFEREPVADNSAVEMYYKDLQKAIGVEDFPIILVDTLLKRTYKMTSKTKFYLLHWTDATKISKKKALSSIKHMSYYMGFQVKVKGKKIDKLYILNHGS